MRTERSATGLRPIRILQLTAFVSTLDRFAMPPMLVAMAVSMDVPLSSVVTAAGIYFLTYGLAQPLWGTVSDLLGRVRTMRLTLLLAGVFTILSTLSMNPVMLGATRGLAGGFFGAAYPSSLIYIGDTVPLRVRQRDIAALMVGVALGTATASLGAGVVADVLTWQVAFLVTGAGSFVMVWLLGRLPEPEHRSGSGSAGRSILGPVREVLRSRMALLVLVLVFVEGAVLLGGLTLLPTAVESGGASRTVAGAVTAVYGVSVFFCARLVGSLSQRWATERLIALGALSAVLAYGLLALTQQPGPVVVAAAVLGLAWVAMHSSLQTWATAVVPSARAIMISLFAGCLFVGSAIAAIGASRLVAEGRFSLIFGVAAAVSVPLGVAATWGRRRWRGAAVTGARET